MLYSLGKSRLDGGFKHFLCSPRKLGEDLQFDDHIFQMGGSTTNQKGMILQDSKNNVFVCSNPNTSRLFTRNLKMAMEDEIPLQESIILGLSLQT